MADPTTTLLAPSSPDAADAPDEFDAMRERRKALQSRHSQALAKLLSERDDLRGVHPLADLVADSLRWSA